MTANKYTRVLIMDWILDNDILRPWKKIYKDMTENNGHVFVVWGSMQWLLLILMFFYSESLLNINKLYYWSFKCKNRRKNLALKEFLTILMLSSFYISFQSMFPLWRRYDGKSSIWIFRPKVLYPSVFKTAQNGRLRPQC